MTDHLDIPLEQLLIYDGDELIFDGSDPSTYLVCETEDDVRRDARRGPGRRSVSTPRRPISYAGVGSRRTPAPVLALMRELGAALARRGWVLRTGGASGADQAFAAGARAARGRVEEFLPWPGFAGRTDARLARPAAAAYAVAARHHPAWARLSPAARALHARNSHQLLGAELDDPAHVLLCWTPDGTLDGAGPRSGGTGQAVRVARAAGVGVVNLARAEHRAFAATFLTRV